MELQKQKVLTPKSFLKEPQNREKYECWICYQVCIKPVRCRGSCGHIFCMKCVSDTRNNNMDRCPSRCSSPFLVTPIPDITVSFYCPYNPSLCQAAITSLNQFHSHYRECQFVPAEELRLKQLQQQYRCLQGHFLEFYVGSYQQMINSKCFQCQQQKVCRSYCRICSQFYCIGCRVPPCSKEGCPIGHSFNFQRIGAINYICDICGISTAVSNGGVYDDNQCNFGLCEACYEGLPDKYDESKPRAIVKNVNTECSCGTKLIQINEVHRQSQCQLCRRQKECPKYCQNCQKRYCIDCKMMDIFSDLTCLQDHSWKKLSNNGNESFMRVQNQFGCMRCQKKKESYFFDHKCYVRLCNDCLIYCMKATTDKQRPISLTCNKNHILNYMTGDEEYQDTCCQCHKTKQIKLVCISCEEEQRMYCFQCKSIPLNTCYFKHKLKNYREAAPKQCQFCREMTKDLFCCKKCSFYVCKECVALSLNGEMEEEEDSRMVE